MNLMSQENVSDSRDVWLYVLCASWFIVLVIWLHSLVLSFSFHCSGPNVDQVSGATSGVNPRLDRVCAEALPFRERATELELYSSTVGKRIQAPGRIQSKDRNLKTGPLSLELHQHGKAVMEHCRSIQGSELMRFPSARLHAKAKAPIRPASSSGVEGASRLRRPWITRVATRSFAGTFNSDCTIFEL
jgi:hypothetical protein